METPSACSIASKSTTGRAFLSTRLIVPAILETVAPLPSKTGKPDTSTRNALSAVSTLERSKPKVLNIEESCACTKTSKGFIDKIEGSSAVSPGIKLKVLLLSNERLPSSGKELPGL